MQKLLFFFLLTLTVPLISFGQYNEAAYTKISEGEDPELPGEAFVVVYQNNQLPAYRLKKVFRDSAYTDVRSKTFFKDSLPEGPYVAYVNNQIALQGLYKNGKWDGERLTYLNGQLLQKAYHRDGVKTGTWEEYNLEGELRRKIVFGSAGEVVSDTKF